MIIYPTLAQPYGTPRSSTNRFSFTSHAEPCCAGAIGGTSVGHGIGGKNHVPDFLKYRFLSLQRRMDARR
jgi:hypothetical protein